MRRRVSGRGRWGPVRGPAALLLVLMTLSAGASPVAPCPGTVEQTFPAYGPLDEAPKVAIWRHIDLSRAAACLGGLRERMEVVVALAGRFRSSLSVEEMARRVGAISKTEGLRYWSVTDGDWRALLSEAFALAAPDIERRRPDFSAAELLSGRVLYTAQRDTRSTGLNLYRFVGRRIDARRMVIESCNVSPIRFIFVELYAPGALRVIHFLERADSGVWAAYTLSAVRSGTLEQDPRSLINRSAAYYRYLSGVASDRDPPLAP